MLITRLVTWLHTNESASLLIFVVVDTCISNFFSPCAFFVFDFTKLVDFCLLNETFVKSITKPTICSVTSFD